MELTIKDIKELLGQPQKQTGDSFLVIGENYLFRSVTMIYTGKLKAENEKQIIIENACWIPDTGRWSNNLKSCEFEEVEPYHEDVIIFKSCLLDVTQIDKLPRVQK